MIAGGTRTRTLVLYMVVLGLNAPVGVAIGETDVPLQYVWRGAIQQSADGTLKLLIFFLYL